MLCNRQTVISCVVWVDTELVRLRSEADHALDTSVARLQKVQTVIELDFNESEALCFLSFFLSFIFYNPSVIGPNTPTPKPPKPYKEGRRCVLSVRGESVCLQ